VGCVWVDGGSFWASVPSGLNVSPVTRLLLSSSVRLSWPGGVAFGMVSLVRCVAASVVAVSVSGGMICVVGIEWELGV
jgi:hypothetical protein